MSLSNRPYDPHTARGFGSFLIDLVRGLGMVDLWRAFALDEIQQRYRRSILGVSWIVISFTMFVGGVAFFFSGFSNAPLSEFIFHVALGYAAFIFITGNFIDGCDVFTNSSVWIKAMPLPYSVHVYRSLFRSVVTYGLQMLVIIPVMVGFGWKPSLITLWVIPAWAVYLLNAVAVQYLLGLVAARFEDVGHLVTSVTRLLIFVTPVLWVREGLEGSRAIAADLNPLTHYVEIFRAPMMGVEARLTSWLVVLALTLVLWCLTALAASMLRRRLPYWL